jgi:ABC-type proline/glycine betaine transport system permease subunit
MAIAIVSYLAAVVIALPLGITGVVDQAYALVPLGIGAFMITVGSLAETRRSTRS